MRSETKITFIGPVNAEGRTLPNGRRVPSYYFLLLQAGGDPLKLEYGDMGSAQSSRRQLLKSSGSHAVPSTKLLQAIYKAMKGIIQEVGVAIPDEITAVWSAPARID